MCEGGPVTKPLSNFEWEQFLFLLGWYREKSRPFVDRAFLFCLKRRSERYVRTVTDAEK